MKRLIWIVVLVAAVKLSGLIPFESSDVAELVPIEALTVDVEGNQVILDGGACQGYGEDWEAALQDLHQGAEGKVFLGTAEQVVLSERALRLLPDIVRCEQLRPAAVICVCPGRTPAPEDVATYLSAHDAGVTIQRVQAAMLARESIVLPRLIHTEGGLRLDGSSNR